LHIGLTKTIGDLLVNATKVSSAPTPQRVSDVLTRIIRQSCEGKTTIFAQVAEFPEDTVKQWVRRETKPRLGAALRICFAFRLTLADLLVHDLETLNIAPVDYVDRSHAQRSSRYTESTKANLTQALHLAAANGEYPPISLQETARRLNCGVYVLRRCDPESCRTIVARYQTYLHQRHEQYVQEVCDDVRRVIRQLRSQGRSVSKSQVTRLLSHPGMMRLPEVYDVYRQLCVGSESAANVPM
jgi:hypothetical protein